MSVSNTSFQGEIIDLKAGRRHLQDNAGVSTNVRKKVLKSTARKIEQKDTGVNEESVGIPRAGRL